MTQARAGDEGAACRLGDAYRVGDGVDQSWEQAFHWYTLGARAGDAEAQNNLGTLYLEGYYCQEDNVQAVYWYRKSAEQGANVAQYNLAMRYIRGEGVPVDYAEAKHWLEMSAESGYSRANVDLAIMYLHGEGCTPDIKKSLSLFDKGTLDDDPDSLYVLAEKLPALEQMALNGDLDDWLAQADLFYHHPTLPDAKPRGWAWMLWADARKSSLPRGSVGDACWFIEVFTDRSMNASTPSADKEKGWEFFQAMMLEADQRVAGKSASDAPKSIASSDTQSADEQRLTARWHEACGPGAPVAHAISKESPGAELILNIGAEGGGIDLYGRRGDGDRWTFWCDLNDWTPTLEDEPAIHKVSESVDSWDAAIAALNKICPHWIHLYPCFVHPQFRAPLLQVVERRLIVDRLVGSPRETE